MGWSLLRNDVFKKYGFNRKLYTDVFAANFFNPKCLPFLNLIYTNWEFEVPATLIQWNWNELNFIGEMAYVFIYLFYTAKSQSLYKLRSEEII